LAGKRLSAFFSPNPLRPGPLGTISGAFASVLPPGGPQTCFGNCNGAAGHASTQQRNGLPKGFCSPSVVFLRSQPLFSANRLWFVASRAERAHATQTEAFLSLLPPRRAPPKSVSKRGRRGQKPHLAFSCVSCAVPAKSWRLRVRDWRAAGWEQRKCGGFSAPKGLRRGRTCPK